MTTHVLNDRFEIDGSLGSGGEGHVFSAVDRLTGARRAIKVIALPDAQQAARALAEFRRLSTLEHPSILTVHDIGVVRTTVVEPPIPKGSIFFTADRLEGDDLNGWGRRKPVAEEILARLEELSSALEAVHSARLLHCDIKPANIVFADGRAVLVDFGLSVKTGDAGLSRGTFSYMDERALAGEPDQESDIHALGASMIHAVTGRPPFSASGVGELIRVLSAEGPIQVTPLLRERCDSSDALAELLGSLVTHRRPRTASELLARISDVQIARGLKPRFRPIGAKARGPRLVGRETIVSAAVAAVRFDPRPGPAVITIEATEGAGAGAVLRELARRSQIAALSRGLELEVLRGDSSRVIQELRATFDDQSKRGDLGLAHLAASADRIIEKLAERGGQRPVLWILDHDYDLDERAVEVVKALAAGHQGLSGAPVTIAARFEVPDAGENHIVRLALEALTLADVTELARGILATPPPIAWLKALMSAALDRPRVITHALRDAADRVERPSPEALVREGDLLEIDAELDRRVDALSEPLVAALAGLAIGGPDQTPEELGELIGSGTEDVVAVLAELVSLDLCVDGSGLFQPHPPALGRAAERSLAPRRRTALHRVALARGNPRPDVRARHLQVIGPVRVAVSAAAEAAEFHYRRGELVHANQAARLALARAEGGELSRVSLIAARIAFASGDYDEAIALAEPASRSRDRKRRSQARRLIARSKQRSGELSAAERELTTLLESEPDDLGTRGALAKIQILRGRYDDAHATTAVLGDPEDLLSRADVEGLELCLEASGLSSLYRRDHAGAERAFGALRRTAVTRQSDSLMGRALALEGLAAHHRGAIVVAAERYRDAAEIARRGGQLHAAATAEINRATAESERGRFASALAALDRALAHLRRLGTTAELAPALFNRAHCLFALGDLSGAEETANRALESARATGRTQFEIYAHLVLGDIARRRVRVADAHSSYDRAASIAENSGSPADLSFVAIARAELLAEQGESRARSEIAAAAIGADELRLVLARARVALALGDADPNLSSDVTVAIETARTQGRENLYWRLSALAARLAAASGDRRAARDLARAAQTEFERLLGTVPPSRQPDVRTDPDVVGLVSLAAELELSTMRDPTSVGDASGALWHRRLLALASRLNSELRLAPLLDQVIDTAIELAGAERGFLLLAREDHTLEVAVARNISQLSLDDHGEDTEVSRSIAERAARSGEIVVAVDAAFDERWEAAESVAAMQLRSVLAVPLRFRADLIGTIYVDHRFQSGAFGNRSVQLVRELANIAGVAIGNARIVRESHARAKEIEILNARLEAELGDRETELATVKAKLPHGEVSPAATEIIGSSPAIRELHQNLERMARAELSVVVTGESGSGKELVARALHRLSPRRNGPFVAVNCGAVAESLLESELFGHVRGAFTGADRNRRGHFEVADGGTLLLDEIADTSPAMQAKLLRVLQEREIRPLGSESVRAVDVRVVAATNRDLQTMVEQGLFREDLFFRLNVLAIGVPPLRERSGDVVEIAEHILARMFASKGTSAPSIARDAARALTRYRWPGNVRELENELARAAALADDGTIALSVLSPRLTENPEFEQPMVDQLDLKARVEDLERELIQLALAESGGNQTRAAKRLGLSRYGLQKKLKRYQIELRPTRS